jgi:cytochrome b subunit of formate dehydrogenase
MSETGESGDGTIDRRRESIRDIIRLRLAERIGDRPDKTDALERLIDRETVRIDSDLTHLIGRAEKRLDRELAKSDRAKPAEKAPSPTGRPDEAAETILRFGINMRIQHMILIVSCLVLIITGLPLKFHDTGWARLFFQLIGGVELSALIHRIGAIGLIGVGFFHLAYSAVTRIGRRDFFALIPMPKDVVDLYKMVRYYIGRSTEKARFGRFSYVEKFDYWAVYWGMVIMITSGLFLWFEEITLHFLPKFIMDIAREAHSDEALLATLAIIIWHFYNVHLNPAKFPMNRVWLTGRLTVEEMEEEHPLEYEEILRTRNESGRTGDGT